MKLQLSLPFKWGCRTYELQRIHNDHIKTFTSNWKWSFTELVSLTVGDKFTYGVGYDWIHLHFSIDFNERYGWDYLCTKAKHEKLMSFWVFFMFLMWASCTNSTDLVPVIKWYNCWMATPITTYTTNALSEWVQCCNTFIKLRNILLLMQNCTRAKFTILTPPLT